MIADPIALLLTALGKALALHGLYSEGHPVRAAARDRAHALLVDALQHRGGLRLSFIEDAVVVGSRVLSGFRAWEWAPRLGAVGVQRLEFDVMPLPTPDDVDRLVRELHSRVAAGTEDRTTVAFANIRFGPLAVAPRADDVQHVGTVVDLLDAVAHVELAEEAATVTWIHDEIAATNAIPMAEVETVIHSLAMAMHQERQLLLPLLDIRTNDEYTTVHSCNVAMLSMGLAQQLGVGPADVRAIGTAALLHDIGKVRIPKALLVKTGALTPEEMEQMRAHPVEGARLLSARGRGHALAATVAYEHHIWDNGAGGYPTLRWPRRCHYASRIVHVCDLYDALSTRRPYREAWPPERTLALLDSRAGIEVDAEMVRAFAELLKRAELCRSATWAARDLVDDETVVT